MWLGIGGCNGAGVGDVTLGMCVDGLGGDSGGGGVWGHAFGNNRSGTDHAVVTYHHILHHAAHRRYIYVVADESRRAMVGADTQELTDVDIITNHRLFIDYYANAMANEESVSNLCA